MGAEAREELEEFVKDPNGTAEKWMPFIRSMWTELQRNERLNHPLFESQVVERALLQIFRSFIYLERHRLGMPIPNTLDRGCNILITGVKGVGKTTLMRGIHRIIETLSDGKIRTCFIDYEQHSSKPSQAVGFPEGEDFNDYGINDWCVKEKTGLICFGDEFPSLYETKESDIAAEWVAIGKSSFAIGIISGSSVSTKALVHKDDPTDERHRGFPNLNYNVYKDFRLHPVRIKADLLKCIRQMKPDFVETDEEVERIFKKSGGVGRRIKDALEGRNTPDHLADELQKDPPFRSLMSRLFVKNETFDIWNQKGLIRSDYVDFIPSRTIDILMDKGYLYFHPTELHYEFLFPEHYDALELYFGTSLRRRELLSLEILLRGWPSGRAPGEVMESMVIKKLIQHKLEPFGGANYEGRAITFTNCENAKESIKIDTKNLKDYIGEVFSFLHDNGAVGVKFNEANEDAFSVDLLQIELGQRGKKIELGKKKSSDASGNFTAILGKAEKAWDTIKDNLPNVKLNSFVLFTSKGL